MRNQFSKLVLWATLASGAVCLPLQGQAAANGVLQVQATVLTQEPANAIQAARAELGMVTLRDLRRPSETATVRLATVECSGCRPPLPIPVEGEPTRLRVVTVQYLRN